MRPFFFLSVASYRKYSVKHSALLSRFLHVQVPVLRPPGQPCRQIEAIVPLAIQARSSLHAGKDYLASANALTLARLVNRRA